MATAFCVADIEAMMLNELLVKKRAQAEAERLKTFLKKKTLDKEQILLKNDESRLKDLSARKTEGVALLCSLQQSNAVIEICAQLQKEKELTKEAAKKWNELHTKEKNLTEQMAQLNRQKKTTYKKVLDLSKKMRKQATDKMEELDMDKEMNGNTGSWPTTTPNW